MGVYRRKDSPYWWARFKLDWMPKTLYFSTETTDRKLAAMVLDDKRNQYQKGKIEGRVPDLLFFEMADGYLEAYKGEKRASAQNVANYLTKFKHIFGNIPVRMITVQRLEMCRTKLLESVQEPTVNRHMATLKKCFNNWIKWERQEVLNGNKPAASVIYNPVCDLHFYPEEERARFRWLLESEKKRLYPILSQRLRDLVTVAVKTGMRQDEQLQLKWPQLDFVTNTVRLGNPQSRTKSRKPRKVPIHPDAKSIFLRLKQDQAKKGIVTEFVFCDEAGMPHSDDGWLRTEFSEARQKAKIKNFRWHDLRHTFGSEHFQAGTPLKLIKEWLGHSNIKTTERYMHCGVEQEKAAMGRIPSDLGYVGVTRKLQVV